MTGCVLDGNKANVHGGAISVDEGVDQFVVSDTTFINNRANVAGAAAMQNSANPTLDKVLGKGVTFKNSQSGCCFIEGFGTDVDWTDGGNSCADVDSAGSRSVQADLLVVPVRSLVLWQLLE